MTTAKYTQDLLSALRLRDVPSDRIGEVLAEVESHVAETGESPYDAFGTPQEYAAAVSPKIDPWSPALWAQAAVGGLTGWALAVSVMSLISGDDAPFGLPAGLLLVVALGLGGLMVWAVHRHTGAVPDPRTGRSMAPSGARPTMVVLTVLVAAVAALAVVLRLVG